MKRKITIEIETSADGERCTHDGIYCRFIYNRRNMGSYCEMFEQHLVSSRLPQCKAAEVKE